MSAVLWDSEPLGPPGSGAHKHDLAQTALGCGINWSEGPETQLEAGEISRRRWEIDVDGVQAV
jgi:hypothetical protein